MWATGGNTSGPTDRPTATARALERECVYSLTHLQLTHLNSTPPARRGGIHYMQYNLSRARIIFTVTISPLLHTGTELKTRNSRNPYWTWRNFAGINHFHLDILNLCYPCHSRNTRSPTQWINAASVR